jgi:hypothetical protein
MSETKLLTHKTKGKIIDFYVLTLKFSDSKYKDLGFWTERRPVLSQTNLTFISS